MVNVYNENSDVIARVKYNQNLDNWDGNNWTCGGGLGIHKGITQLADGQYVLIRGSQWEGIQSTAEVISTNRAIQEILRSDNADELLKKYGLTKEADKMLVKEA